jgi:hypothetical protein
MFSKSTNVGRHVTSAVNAHSSRSNVGYAPAGDLADRPLSQSSFSDLHLSQALEAEREEASHHLAILANSIFASVGC